MQLREMKRPCQDLAVARRLTARRVATLLVTGLLALLVACGGGGGGTPTPAALAALPDSATVQGEPAQIDIGITGSVAADLLLSASSSNQALVPNGGLTFSGSGAQRSLTANPLPGQSGSTVITVTLSNSLGVLDTEAFTLTVQASDSTGFQLQRTLIASDASESSNFGISVAMSGTTALVGADGVNVITPAGLVEDAGAAYVFDLVGGIWQESQRLIASTPAEDDWFGTDVDIDGDLAVVGAPGDSTAADTAGAAHIFTRGAGGDWVATIRLESSNPLADTQFGRSVAVSGTTVVVSARHNEAGMPAGTVFVYEYVDSAWEFVVRLEASDSANNNNFGASVALEGDTLVVGADNAPGASASGRGAVYVFTREAGIWSQATKLVRPGTTNLDHFGAQVSLTGNSVFASATGMDAWFDESRVTSAGMAFEFRGGGASWAPQPGLSANPPLTGGAFSRSAVVMGNTLIVSEHHAAVPPEQRAGKVHVFGRSGDAWVHTNAFTAPTPSQLQNFGYGMASNGTALMVGAPGYEDTHARQGAVFVYGQP